MVVERPADSRAGARNVAHNHEAEGVLFLVVESKLTKRNPELRHPAERVNASGDVPHSVPRLIFIVVIIHIEVTLDARRIDTELVTRAPIMIGVDHQLQLLGAGTHVTATKERDNAIGCGIVHASQHIEILVVVGDADFGLEPCLSAFLRLVLEELIDHLHVLPGGVVGLAVEHGRTRCARRHRRRSRRARNDVAPVDAR